ncbi:hypothetical protein NL676_034408 [Syzygium grande]|nr:hypothetical protein NL676_034408 [Syzygium grande]
MYPRAWRGFPGSRSCPESRSVPLRVVSRKAAEHGEALPRRMVSRVIWLVRGSVSPHRGLTVSSPPSPRAATWLVGLAKARPHCPSAGRSLATAPELAGEAAER